MENSKGHGKSSKVMENDHNVVIFTEAAGAQEQRMNSCWTVVIFVNMCK